MLLWRNKILNMLFFLSLTIRRMNNRAYLFWISQEAKDNAKGQGTDRECYDGNNRNQNPDRQGEAWHSEVTAITTNNKKHVGIQIISQSCLHMPRIQAYSCKINFFVIMFNKYVYFLENLYIPQLTTGYNCIAPFQFQSVTL